MNFASKPCNEFRYGCCDILGATEKLLLSLPLEVLEILVLECTGGVDSVLIMPSGNF